MAGKIYTTDGKIISDGFPQIQIGDKFYRVDTRKTSFVKMQKAIEAESKKAGGKDEAVVVLEHALGKEAAKEIEALDLTVSGYMNLITYIQAAIFDVSFEEAQARFQKAQV